MDKGWRMGEVAGVTVSLEPAASRNSHLAAVKFCLQVQACSRFLHPASHCALLDFSAIPAYSLFLRYSELAAMHKQLIWLYKSLPLPQFPPKKWLVINAEGFLQQRTALLNEYFAALLEIGEVRRSQVLLQTLAPPTQIRLKLIGPQGSGKSRFIQNFLQYSPSAADQQPRTSVTLLQGAALSERDNSTPIDLIVDGKTVRITSIEYITVREGENTSWFLQGVKDISITLVAKPAISAEKGEQPFAESRCAGCGKGDEKDGKYAYETITALLREYVTLA